MNNHREEPCDSSIILHVLVVGFHHKHGSQIEYCYPPIGGSSRCPEAEPSFPKQWIDIASLAIPDGAHNIDSDVIYFMLPSLEVRNRAVYGISCYRQIAVDEEFRRLDEELTRSTVQKSVCVLSTVPLYGALKSKLQLITEAYFNERDFSKVEVLNQMYNNLSDLFDFNYVDTQTIYSGFSLLPLLKIFKHRALVLFKLLMLEKKVIFKVFPVMTLGDILIGLISLFPGLLDKGLSESAFYSAVGAHSKYFTIARNEAPIDLRGLDGSFEISVTDGDLSVQSSTDKHRNVEEAAVECAESNDAPLSICKLNSSLFDTDEFGFPLSIFTKGSVFHPYLNINSIDMLRSDSVRAFCVGVTNSLFIQRSELVDVIVTVDEKGDGQVDILSLELKKQLALTKQDLRFVDFLLRMIEFNGSSLWEGSDDWVRSQFFNYLVAMLATASAVEKTTKAPVAGRVDMSAGNNAVVYAQEFNYDFIVELHSKHNYRVWSSVEHPSFRDVSPRHQFAGQFSVNDVLLRVNHAMNDSGQGRRVLSAFSNTGRLVVETKSRVQSSLTSWWSRDTSVDASPSNSTSATDGTEAAKDVDDVQPKN